MQNRTKKILIGVGILFIVLVTVLIGLFVIPKIDQNGWKHYTNNTVQNAKDENNGKLYALVNVKKDDWTDISEHKYIEKVTSILMSYSDKIRTTFVFEDGTGIMYPGSDVTETAFYGKVDDEGNVTSTIGYISIKGQSVDYREVESFLSEDSSELFTCIPKEYQTDSAYANLFEGTAYITVATAPDKSSQDVANEIYQNIKDAEISAEQVHILVNADAYELVGETMNKTENSSVFIK